MHRSLCCFVICTVALASVAASAQDGNPAWKKLAGAPAEKLATESLRELQLSLAPQRLEAVERQVGQASKVLETVSEKLSESMIEYQRLQDAKGKEGELAKVEAKAETLHDLAGAIISRINVLIQAAEQKGSDQAELKKYIAVVEELHLPTTKPEGEAPSAEDKAKAAVRAVQDEPPVHEREEPWVVPTAELELELQPLQQEQLEERVKQWMALLQRELRNRVRIDIALQKNEDQAQKETLAKMATEQQAVVQALVERADIATKVFAERGGDIASYQGYIGNATGRKIDTSDPTVLYAQIKAWFTSPEGGTKIALGLLKFLAILLGFWLASRLLGGFVRAALKRVPGTSQLLDRFLVGGTKRVTMVIGLLVALSALGVNITPLAAAIGAAGLVVGLALQGTLSNFASGVLILIYRPFDVGDVISAGGVLGTVSALNLFSTRIDTLDNQVNLVPNDAIWNNVITNITAQDTRRVDLMIGIGYGDDIAKAQEIIEDVLDKHPKVLAEPAPVVKVHELGDNSVNFVVRPWSKTADYWDIHWDVTRKVKERFDEEGVNIPFPQRDLHVQGPLEVVMKPTS